MAASVISLERVGLVILYTVGYTLTLFPRESVHEFFNVADTNDAMAAAELDMFAFANVIGFVLLLTWAFYEFKGVGYLGKLKGTMLSTVSKEMAAKKIV